MKANLVIDIETRADDRLDTPEYWQRIKADIPDNRSIKDPVKQAAWIDGKLEDYRKSMALRPTTGRIAAIGIADIEDPFSADVLCNLGDEYDLLFKFAKVLEDYQQRVVCGFNCREFDIPFISARCAIHEIVLPRWWPFMRDWQNVADLYDVLGRQGKLDDWLIAFGMEPKPCTGAESLDLTEEELAEYCRMDVRATAQLFARLWERFPALWAKKERKALA